MKNYIAIENITWFMGNGKGFFNRVKFILLEFLFF